MKNLNIATLLVIISTVSLTGCGGGGGSSANIQPDPVTDPFVINDGGDTYVPPPTNIEKAGVDLWHANGFTGQGSVVAVLDSGTDNFNEDYDVSLLESVKFDSNYSRDWGNAADDGYTANADTSTSTGTHGHDMSQVIGSKAVGGIGIAPDASLIHGVISSNGMTSSASIWKGLEWANAHGAVVANLSFEFGGMYQFKGTDAQIEANQYAYKHDITNSKIARDIIASGMAIVHSAGNNDSNLSDGVYQDAISATIVYTPIKDSLIIVGALSTDLSAKATYSNYAGADVAIQSRFLMAPGTEDVMNAPDIKGTVTGTSPAAAYVSGSIATMKSRWTSLTGKELAQILLDTADNTFAGYDAFYHGQGKLDMVAAYSPIGQASFKTVDNKSAPIYAASVAIPPQFEQQTFNASFVDSYDRDYEATFTTQKTGHITDLNNKLISAMNGKRESIVGYSGNAVLTASEGYTGYESDSKVVGFDGFTKDMFAGTRQMQELKLRSGDLSIGVATNLADQLNATSDSLKGQGVTASLGYKNVNVSVYSANEDAQNVFYGAKDRDATGVKVAYNQDAVTVGVEMNQNKYNGSSLVNGMTEQSQAIYLGYDVVATNNFKLGVTGKLKASELNVDMTLPKSNGDGSLSYANESLTSKSNSVSKGVYAQAGNLNLTAYADEYDNAVTLSYKSQF